MSYAWMLMLAMLIDAALGEPDWLWKRIPHPAVLMGRVIGWADQRFNKWPAQERNGILLMIALIAFATLLGWAIAQLGWLAEVLVAAILLAQRSLSDHVKAVADALRLSLGDGRLMVGHIVSRDTSAMDESGVARSAIESAAENLSDGVIAPAFWFLAAGLPGILVYKFVNTADSMIGYRTARHEQFGKPAALLDDALNWVPARLTAALIVLVNGITRQWPMVRLDAAKHRSPNAGWPEAAMARALGVAISGPRAYNGKLIVYPYVNEEGRRVLTPEDIDAACLVLWHTWGVTLALTSVLAVLSFL